MLPFALTISAVSALSGATTHCEVYPSMVRWRSCGLDDLHALLPSAPPGGICLRTSERSLSEAANSSDVSYGLALCGASDVAYHTWRRLETGSLSESDLANTGLVNGLSRSSLFRSFVHRPLDAELV